MQRTWTEVGAEWLAGEEANREDGERIIRKYIADAIDTLEWADANEEVTLAAMPALAITAAIKELDIPKVSQYAITDALAPYGLYGIEGNYKNGRARVYLIDRGGVLTPVASDFWPKPLAETMNVIGYEARCTKCGETFNPHGESEEDLEHWVREDGVACGGQGELVGAWGTPK